MTESSELRADESGQVIGVSHHDGRIRALIVEDGGQIELLITGSGGEEATVVLLGVEYLAMNNLREGNIIDRMYRWPLAKAPPLIMRRMLAVLSIASEDVLVREFGDNAHVFHLECSYGAELFALVHGAKVKL